MSFENDDLDMELACSAEQAEQEAKAAEEAKDDKTLTQLVDAEEFLATEGVPLLEYEKQMFLDLLHTDALVVCAKGITYERAMLNLLKIFCDTSTLVLVVNCSEAEEQYYRTNLDHSEHIHESAKTAAERERAYLQGGIQFISTRILVVDLLKNRIPIELITGMFVVRAHEIVESCQEAFALRLYRQRNKVGFIKAFSRNVEAFTYGYGHVEKVMRNLFVKELFIWPRFHMTIQRSLKPYEPGVVEIQIPMTQNMILLQTNLLDLMNYLVKSIKTLNRFVELQEVTVENCVTKKFHKILQAQLDTIWHQLSSQTKLIVADLKVLRSLMISCLYGDSVSFYALLKRYRTTEYALHNSGWTILDAAEKVFTIAKERVFNRENEFEPELSPKWKALSDVLRVDIPNDIKEKARKIRKQEERNKFMQQQVKILILCQDSRACYQLNQFLTQGPERYLFYQAIKNDISIAKLSDEFKHITSETDLAAYRIQEFEPVARPKPPTTPAVPGAKGEATGSSSSASKGAPAKGGFLRERIANKRRELAEEQEARKRKEMEEQEAKERGEGVDDSGGAKKSDMETELAAVRTDEQDHQQYFRDAYVLTMSQRTVAVPMDAADEQSSQFDVSMLESGVFESFVEMEQMDITTVVKESNRPLVFIQTFKSETSGLGSLDRTLEQIRPRYIVMYHTNVTAIRQIEVYEARQQRQEMARVRVYAIIHSKTVEEQSYLTSLRREKQAFELLIETKRTMVVPAEYYDGKLKRYVDMPITDVLQMMGRAGRPQFGNEGIACVYVQDTKKNFYKKFLYDPFPVESSLLAVLPDHVNAEIVAGTLRTKQSILDYLTWTYFYRRLLRNPTYYGLDTTEMENVNYFLSELIETVLDKLIRAGCVLLEEDNRSLMATSMGRISSYYYLSHITMRHFADTLRHDMNMEELLRAMADAAEFEEHPVRHNEDLYNADLAKLCPLKVDPLSVDNPHTKVFLLLQAHLSRLPLPNSDYGTDTKSVLDQSIRILQAMVDISAERGWLATTLRIQQLMQCIIQARWLDDPVVMTLPNVEAYNAAIFSQIKTDLPFLTLPALKEKCNRKYENLAATLRQEFEEPEIEQIYKVICELPSLNVQISVRGPYGKDGDVDRPVQQPMSRDQWIELYADQEYVVCVQLIRLGAFESLNIHCPKFPKGKDEGWFLTLGHQAEGEVVALKRCVYRSNRSTHQLCFYAPSRIGRCIYTVYLVSDGYIGLDQQYSIQFEVVPPPEGEKDGLQQVLAKGFW